MDAQLWVGHLFDKIDELGDDYEPEQIRSLAIYLMSPISTKTQQVAGRILMETIKAHSLWVDPESAIAD